MGLGLGCFGAVADGERKVSPTARHAGECLEAKEQERELNEKKVQKGDETSGKQVAAARKEKKKDAVVMQHQFPFHSRPGLL
jgi:hypothetical protein